MHAEGHRGRRAGWLRAAVLGADDGIVSTASLVIGVAASAASRSVVLVAGLAGLVAGAMSMATGEYVSVSSQRDAERADVAQERDELAANPDLELGELTAIYRRRGLDEELARTVAGKLMALDPLAAHVRDELGLRAELLARPVQAAVVSAGSFALGAVLPLLAVALAPAAGRILAVAGAALVVLGVLGWVGGRLGGASPWRGAGRVLAGVAWRWRRPRRSAGWSARSACRRPSLRRRRPGSPRPPASAGRRRGSKMVISRASLPAVRAPPFHRSGAVSSHLPSRPPHALSW